MYYLYGHGELRVFVARLLVVVVCVGAFLYAAVPAYAHSGNTAADGCHHCWTDCDYYGFVRGERHCHGGTASAIAPDEVTGEAMCTPTRVQHESWLRDILTTGGGLHYLIAIIAQVAMEREGQRE